jgi:hypothetical protein
VMRLPPVSVSTTDTPGIVRRAGGSQTLWRAAVDIGDVGSPPQAGAAQPLTVDAGAGAGTCTEDFKNTGIGLTKHELGPISSFGYYLNRTEIKFAFDFNSFPKLRSFRPVQWAGPESEWVKGGNPFTAANWEKVSYDPQGKGSDVPLPENVFRSTNVVAFYDSPGPNLLALNRLKAGLSRYVVKQNVTASVDGDPGLQRHVCQDIAWHSVVHRIHPPSTVGGDGQAAASSVVWRQFQGSNSESREAG